MVLGGRFGDGELARAMAPHDGRDHWRGRKRRLPAGRGDRENLAGQSGQLEMDVAGWDCPCPACPLSL